MKKREQEPQTLTGPQVLEKLKTGREKGLTPAQVQQVIEESAVDYAPAPYEYADGKLTVKTELVTNDLAFIRIVK